MSSQYLQGDSNSDLTFKQVPTQSSLTLHDCVPTQDSRAKKQTLPCIVVNVSGRPSVRMDAALEPLQWVSVEDLCAGIV